MSETQTLYVVEEDSKISPEGNAGEVIVESAQEDAQLAIEELSGNESKNLAIRYAGQHGVTAPALNGMTRPYPINSQGRPLTEVRNEDGSAPSPSDPRMEVAAYRVRVPVAQSRP